MQLTNELPHDKTNKMACAPSELRSALASAQSDQSLRCPHEESLGPQLPTERTGKTLIRLGGCPGWSESSLGAHAMLLGLSWGGSNTAMIIKSALSLVKTIFPELHYIYNASSVAHQFKFFWHAHVRKITFLCVLYFEILWLSIYSESFKFAMHNSFLC